jgi:hypothetical protein
MIRICGRFSDDVFIVWINSTKGFHKTRHSNPEYVA